MDQMWAVKGRVKGFGPRTGGLSEKQLCEERSEDPFWICQCKTCQKSKQTFPGYPCERPLLLSLT